MSKTNTDSLTPYQRAAVEWFQERPKVYAFTVSFSGDETTTPGILAKADTIDRRLIRNVPHYAEVFCKALKLSIEGETQ